MSKKVLLFLSELRQEPGKESEKEYLCPDESKVSGVQSNEAPVKYLLRHYEDVSEILCVVTKEAKECREKVSKSGWDWFCESIKAIKKEIIITEIPCDGEDSETFIKGPMQQILEKIESGDELLLETTGGFRNAIIYMILAARILSHAGIQITGAVYSNFQKGKIEDLSQTMQLFELVEGMKEMTSFGSVSDIRKYYEQTEEKDEKIKNLLVAVEEMTESISLCRTDTLDAKMEQFNIAMQDAKESSDLLFRQLLKGFRQKFGAQWNVFTILRWCVDSGMIQQAMTIYTEKMPAYIIKQGLLEVDRDVKVSNKLEHEDENAAVFVKGFLKLAEKKSIQKKFQNYLKTHNEVIVSYSKRNKIGLPKNDELYTGVENVVRFIRHFYFETKHDFSEKGFEKLGNKYPVFKNKEIKNYFSTDKKQGKNAQKMINLISNDEKIQSIFLQVKAAKEKNTYAETLENLEKWLPDSGYTIHCSLEQMRRIAKDYLYIKQLRNIANHANSDSNTDDSAELMDYLCGEADYYQKPEKTNIKQISDVILKGIAHIEEAEEHLHREPKK